MSAAEAPINPLLPLPYLKAVLDGMDEGEIPRIVAPVLSVGVGMWGVCVCVFECVSRLVVSTL